MIFLNLYIGSSSEDFIQSSIQGKYSRHVSKEFEVIIYQPQTSAAFMYVCMYVYMYVCMYVCMYVYMYVWCACACIHSTFVNL